MAPLAAAVEDEGHPEPDFPDRDPSPYDILRDGIERAFDRLHGRFYYGCRCNECVVGGLLDAAVFAAESDSGRAMYLAAGGAE